MSKNYLIFSTILVLSSFSAQATSKKQKAAETKESVSAPLNPPPTPLSDQDRKILDRGEISTGRYVGGGLVGTFFGLGIGQGVQGRYQEKGWVFTVGELASLGLVIGGLSSCTTDIYDSRSCGGGAKGVISIGVLALIGFRVWELIDVWVTPLDQNDEYKRVKDRADKSHLSFFVLPSYENTPWRLGMHLKF